MVSEQPDVLGPRPCGRLKKGPALVVELACEGSEQGVEGGDAGGCGAMEVGERAGTERRGQSGGQRTSV